MAHSPHATILGGALVALTIGLAPGCGHRRQPTTDDFGLPFTDEHDSRALLREPVFVDDRPQPGLAVPYPLDHIFGMFGDCRSGGRQHAALDIGGVGPAAGLGTPVRAMVRSRITAIGRPEDDPARYGRPDNRGGTTRRSGVDLPRSADIAGYGRVAFFTRDYGSGHTGAMISTEAIGTTIDGHRVRYMHLGAVHPQLAVGDEVEAGQEIGLMGGTAVMESLPHVHIDIETPGGRRIDVAPLLGMAPDTNRCR